MQIKIGRWSEKAASIHDGRVDNGNIRSGKEEI